jgi:hypothetical protein
LWIFSYSQINKVYSQIKESYSQITGSKQEAGEWGMVHLPIEFQPTIQKALEGYTNQNQMVLFEERELLLFREYISGELSQEHGSIQK